MFPPVRTALTPRPCGPGCGAYPLRSAARARTGYTLVDAAIFALAISTLAALALPLVLDARPQARIASAHHARVAVQKAAEAVHQAWLSRGDGRMGISGIRLEDGRWMGLRNGYPDVQPCCSSVGADGLVDTSGYRVRFPGGTQMALDVASASDPAQCGVIYRPSPAPGQPYVVEERTDGC